jgi:hypothetical protein
MPSLASLPAPLLGAVYMQQTCQPAVNLERVYLKGIPAVTRPREKSRRHYFMTGIKGGIFTNVRFNCFSRRHYSMTPPSFFYDAGGCGSEWTYMGKLPECSPHNCMQVFLTTQNGRTRNTGRAPTACFWEVDLGLSYLLRKSQISIIISL